MAQDITLLGASYTGVPAVTLPKTGGGTASFTDVTDTTATADDVAEGKYFYSAAGVRTLGTGAGAGVSYAKQAVGIPSSAWSGTTATVSASAVTETNDVIVSPAPESVSAWASAGVYCSAQGDGTLTFTCSTAPSDALTANVLAFDGGTDMTLYAIAVAGCSVDKQQAVAGETVTATATAACSIKASTNASGILPFASTDGYINAGATWSFTMPASNVWVIATAKPR